MPGYDKDSVIVKESSDAIAESLLVLKVDVVRVDGLPVYEQNLVLQVLNLRRDKEAIAAGLGLENWSDSLGERVEVAVDLALDNLCPCYLDCGRGEDGAEMSLVRYSRDVEQCMALPVNLAAVHRRLDRGVEFVILGRSEEGPRVFEGRPEQEVDAHVLFLKLEALPGRNQTGSAT